MNASSLEYKFPLTSTAIVVQPAVHRAKQTTPNTTIESTAPNGTLVDKV